MDPVCSFPLLSHQVFSFETAPSRLTRSVPVPRASSAGTRTVWSVMVQPRPQAHTHNPPTYLTLKVNSRQPLVWSHPNQHPLSYTQPHISCLLSPCLHLPISPRASQAFSLALCPPGPLAATQLVCFSRDPRGQDRSAHSDSGQLQVVASPNPLDPPVT